jgi:hypothetical protein
MIGRLSKTAGLFAAVWCMTGALTFQANAENPGAKLVGEGRELRCPFTLSIDDFRFTLPTPTTGGAGVAGELAWKRGAR